MADFYESPHQGEQPPAWRETPGASTDRPQVNIVAVLDAYDRETEDGRADREVTIPGVFTTHDKPAQITVRESMTPDEVKSRREYRAEFSANIARLGNRRLLREGEQLTERAATILATFATLNDGLVELEPDTSTDLGETGEYNAEEYGARVHALLSFRATALRELRLLTDDVEEYGKRCDTGGYIMGLDHICTYPEVERRYVEVLQSRQAFPEQPTVAAPPAIDLAALETLKLKTVKRLNRVERTYAELEARDARRARLARASLTRLADNAAVQGADRGVVDHLRP
jgi:hypothetical protein